MSAPAGGPAGPWVLLGLVTRAMGYPDLCEEIREAYRARRPRGALGANLWLLRQLLALRFALLELAGRLVARSGTGSRQVLRRLRRRPSLAAPFALVLGGGLAATVFMAEVRDAMLNPRLGIDADVRLLSAVDSSGRDDRLFPIDDQDPWTRALPAAAGAIFTRAAANDVVQTPTGLISTNHAVVSEGMISGVGGRLAVGRDATGPGEIVLSHRFWTTHWLGRPALGELLTVGEARAEVVGITAPGFDGVVCCVRPSFWMVPAEPAPRRHTVISVGAPDSAAAAGLVGERLAARGMAPLRIELPRASAAAFGGERGMIGRSLGVIFWLAVVALAAAVLNAGNLLVADVLDRRDELAVRRALGGGRAALVSLIAQQAGWLTAGAAVVGGLLVWAMLAAAPQLLPFIGIDSVLDIGFGGVGTTVGLVGTGAAIVLCTAPSLISAGVVRPSARLERRSVGPALVAAQTTLGTVLVVLAGMLLGQSRALDGEFFGFRHAEVGVFPVRASEDRGASATAILTAARNASGGSPVALTRRMPVYGAAPDTIRLASGEPFTASVEQVTEGYYEVLGLEISSGRPARADHEVVVSGDLLPTLGGNPLGGTLMLRGTELRIVGIAEPATWGTGRPRPTLYRGWAPERLSGGLLLLGPRGSTRPSLADVAREMTPIGYAASWFGTLAELRVRSRVLTVFLERLATLFAGLCIVVVVTGIYAHFTRWARTRQRELGIRHALGARPSRLRGAVYGAAAPSLGAGIMLGIAASWYLGGQVARAIGLSTPSPGLLVAGALIVAATAALSLAPPAIRVVRHDPGRLLGSE